MKLKSKWRAQTPSVWANKLLAWVTLLSTLNTNTWTPATDLTWNVEELYFFCKTFLFSNKTYCTLILTLRGALYRKSRMKLYVKCILHHASFPPPPLPPPCPPPLSPPSGRSNVPLAFFMQRFTVDFTLSVRPGHWEHNGKSLLACKSTALSLLELRWID